jgi:hypothetical protein
MKHIDEYYKDWSGEHHTINSNRKVHDSSEVIDFAEYFYKENTKWQYPEQNELPKNLSKVFCIDKNNQPKIGYHEETDVYWKFIDNHNSYFYCIAWCECPAFL